MIAIFAVGVDCHFLAERELVNTNWTLLIILHFFVILAQLYFRPIFRVLPDVVIMQRGVSSSLGASHWSSYFPDYFRK